MDEYLETGKNLQRLFDEYKKHGSLTIGFDFDSTVHDYHKKGSTYNSVIDLLRDLKSINCKLICWTAYKDHAYVINFLIQNDIPFDGVNTDGVELPWETRKPFFNALLDDRAGLIQVYSELRELADSIMLHNKIDKDYHDLTTEEMYMQQARLAQSTGILPTNGTHTYEQVWDEMHYTARSTWDAAQPNFDFSGIEITPSIDRTAGATPDNLVFDEIAHTNIPLHWDSYDQSWNDYVASFNPNVIRNEED